MKTFFVCLAVVAAAMAAEQRDKRGLLAPAIATPWGASLAAPGILAPRVAIGAPAIAAPGILAPRLAIGTPGLLDPRLAVGAPAIATPAIATPLNAPLLSRTVVSPWAGHAPLVW